MPRLTKTLPALLLAMLVGATAAQARVFTVNTTADTADAVPGDGICADLGGACSLRAAITEANGGAAPGDQVVVPAGVYTLTQGNLVVTASMSIVGAGSALTIIDGNLDGRGVLELGQFVYSQRLVQGTNTATGQPVPQAVITSTDSFLNCLAAEGCLGKPGLVDSGGQDPIPPISFTFTLSAPQIAAVNQASGVGLLTVEASRDLGHKQGIFPTGVADVLPTTLDGTTVPALFDETTDSCPVGVENFGPINFDCGPNFHNDVIAVSSRYVSEADFKAGAQDGSIQVVLSPTTGAGNLGVGRLKIFSATLHYLKQPSVTLRGLTVQRGGDPAVRTATIFSKGASVDATDFVVKSSFGSVGGAIWNELGPMTLRDCTIANNTAYAGGGIYNARLGVLTLERCTVNDNLADEATNGSGGGILNSGTLKLRNSTISANLAKLGGGGIKSTGNIDADFSTITNNSADYALSGGFDKAAVGGGIASVCVPGSCGYVTMGNSILAGNRDGRDTGLPHDPALVSPDCFSPGDPALTTLAPFYRPFNSSRNNIVGIVVPAPSPGAVNTICDIRDLDSNVSGDTPYDKVGTPGNPVDPSLDPLADNGGYARTHALPAGSPAIDGVTAEPGVNNCLPTDQRGFRRPGDAPGDTHCDIGAYEAGGQTAVPEDAATHASPVTVSFGNLTQPGITRLEILNTGPAPSAGFMLGNPPLYYEISTTTTFVPPATVCINYSGTSFQNDAMLQLRHYEDTNGDGTPDAWVDRTISNDTVNKIICANVSSFSLFAPMERVNRAPSANAGPDRTVECDATAPVTLDGSASSDPDGDALGYEWRNAAGTVVGTAKVISLMLPPGVHTFTLSVSDPSGLKSTDGVVIRVRDTTRPAIERITASPDVLWPPNGAMVPVTIAVSVADRCDVSSSCRIVSVSSNEPCSGHGRSPDWQITGDLTLKLRAEREGRGRGRVYTIVIACRDAAGNSARGTVTVRVPHDRR